MPQMSKSKALDTLCDIYGYNDMYDMLEAATFDSVAPGICRECGYSIEVEPDSDSGWCEECNKGSVVSCLVLAGII